VVFRGFVPDPGSYYQALDLFAMSSITEQMPMVLLEAMAARLPIVCTAVGDSAEIIGNPGRPAVVPPEDASAYVEALRELGRDAGLRKSLGGANHRRSLEVYSVERMIAAYRKLYLTAVSG
jgi:glycosyltransferase involved in cell wall biosynthesis